MLPPDEPMRTGSFTFKPPYESEAWETEWAEGQPLQSPAWAPLPLTLFPLRPETFCCDPCPLARPPSSFQTWRLGCGRLGAEAKVLSASKKI